MNNRKTFPNNTPLWQDERFHTVKCDSEDGNGCGHVWLEGFGLFQLACPRCGRLVRDGNIIVNDGDTPDLEKLDNPNVLVVFDEVAI